MCLNVPSKIIEVLRLSGAITSDTIKKKYRIELVTTFIVMKKDQCKIRSVSSAQSQLKMQMRCIRSTSNDKNINSRNSSTNRFKILIYYELQ